MMLQLLQGMRYEALLARTLSIFGSNLEDMLGWKNEV